MSLRIKLRNVNQAVGIQVVGLSVAVTVVPLYHIVEQIRSVGDDSVHAQLQLLLHRGGIVYRVHHHRVAGLLKRPDVENFAGGGVQSYRWGLPVARYGGRITIRQHHVPGRHHRRFGAAVDFRVAPHGVHDAQCTVLFVIGVLGSANLSLRILRVGQGNGGFQHLPLIVSMNEKRPKLVAEPQSAVVRTLYGFYVKICPGEDAFFGKVVNDGKRHVSVGIVQFNKTGHLNVSLSAVFGFEVRYDGIHAQVIVRRVLNAAEAVVRHHQVRSVFVVQHGRKALHGLLIYEGNRLFVDGAFADVLSGGRARGKRSGRQHGPSFQDVGVLS